MYQIINFNFNIYCFDVFELLHYLCFKVYLRWIPLPLPSPTLNLVVSSQNDPQLL